MQRRQFIRQTLAILGGITLGSPLWSVLDAGETGTWNRREDASRNILRKLRETGLLASLEMLDARVLGGSVYSLARGILPGKIQLEVAEERFDEAGQTLGQFPAMEIELWSDRFSCCRLGGANPALTLFSSLSYLARFESGHPLGLFRHHTLSFDVRRRITEDFSGWLALDQPRLELSPEATRHFASGEAGPLELLLLAGMEESLFGIAFGADLEQARKTVRAQRAASPTETRSLPASLHHGRQDGAPDFDFFPNAS